MAEIFNKDVSVLGELSIAADNATGNVVMTNSVTGLVTYRTMSELSSDLVIASGNADANYVHDQTISSISWSVTHNLNKKASVTVVDSAGTVVVGEVEYLNDNSITITFNAAFSGYAYFN